MKVIIDTNIILDVLLKREKFLDKSSKVILLSEKKIIEGFVSASAVTDIFYITNKTYKDKQKSMGLLKELLKTVGVAAVTEREIFKAIDLEWNDFEDAVQYTTAEKIQADYIITRDFGGYKDNAIPAIQPEDFLDMINKKQGIVKKEK